MSFTTKYKKNDIIFVCLVFLLIVVAGFRPVGLDADSENYANFLKLNADTLSILTKEPGFWLVTKVNMLFFNGNITSFFFIFAAIAMSIKAYAIRKLSPFPLCALYAYFCVYFILHEMTQIRVAVAAGIFLLSVSDVYERNFKGFLFKVLLACMFHYSALVMVFAYFINLKKINRYFYFALPFLGIFLAFKTALLLNLLSSYINFLPAILSLKIQLYIDQLNEGRRAGLNLFNFYYTTILIFYYVLLFNIGKLKCQYDLMFFKMLSFSLFAFYSLSFLPVLSFRIAEFFGIFVVFLFAHFFTIYKEKQLVFCLTVVWLAAYFLFVSVMKTMNI